MVYAARVYLKIIGGVLAAEGVDADPYIIFISRQTGNWLNAVRVAPESNV